MSGHRGGANLLLLGVEYADGHIATTLGGRVATADGAPGLSGTGSSGGGRTVDTAYFLTPLPPSGPLTIVCAWPARGIPETTTVLDGAEITAAASRVEVLWPLEPDAPSDPEPPTPPQLPTGGWFERVLGR